MTKQETFDTVARHLLTQGRRAVDENETYRYRTDTGLKCAAGCLIPDDKYNPVFEGSAVIVNRDRRNGLENLLSGLGHDLSFVSQLQRIHDFYLPDKWVSELRKVADNHQLSPAVLEEF